MRAGLFGLMASEPSLNQRPHALPFATSQDNRPQLLRGMSLSLHGTPPFYGSALCATPADSATDGGWPPHARHAASTPWILPRRFSDCLSSHMNSHPIRNNPIIHSLSAVDTSPRHRGCAFDASLLCVTLGRHHEPATSLTAIFLIRTKRGGDCRRSHTLTERSWPASLGADMRFE